MPASTILDQAIGDLRKAAEYFERGQADTPLTDAVEQLAVVRHDPEVLILLYGENASIRQHAAAWLTGGRIVEVGPEDIAARLGGLLDEARGRPAVLAVAGELPEAGEAIEALEVVGASVAAFLPITVEGRGPLRRLGGHRLPGARLGAAEPPPSPFDGEAGAALRLRLTGAAQAQQMLTTVELLAGRHEAELRQMQARQKRDMALDRPETAAAPAEAGPDLSGLRAALNDELARIGLDMREAGRKTGLRSGPVLTFLEELLANIDSGDLEQEAAGKKIRLSLSPAVSEDLCDRFSDILRTQVAADYELLTRGLDAARSRLSATHPVAAPALARLAAPDFGSLWGPIEEGIHLQARYRGEIAKRGFLQRLGEGRRVIFLVLMVASLFGSFMGFNIRRMTGMGPIFLILFVITVAYTFTAWRKEDRINLDDELIRLRDLLRTEFQRMLSDAMRERQSRLQLMMDEIRRQAAGELEALVRGSLVARSAESETERRASRARLKVTDQRVKELQLLGPVIAKARTAAERALTESMAEPPRVPRATPLSA